MEAAGIEVFHDCPDSPEFADSCDGRQKFVDRTLFDCVVGEKLSGNAPEMKQNRV